MNRIATLMALAALTALAALLLLPACSQQDPTTQAPPAAGSEAPAVFVAERPAGEPVPIPEARKSLKPGDPVLLTGLVMGVPEPFVAGRAVFVLGDEATLTPCNAKGHGCRTPWDNCCDPLDLRLKGTATIQVLGSDGKVLPRGLKGVGDLAELSRVTLAGTVAPGSTPEAFVVNATAIHAVRSELSLGQG